QGCNVVCCLIPRVLAALQPWAEISERLRRKFKLMHYLASREGKVPGEKTFRRGLTLMQVVLASGGLGPKQKLQRSHATTRRDF
ncbi:MAG TPA: hypothetical protein VJR02_04360, partial [Pyrinomonadaceae bacterium]|nr:hypothetical protein [Pyrinomonadaceae bacterium]